MSVQNILVCYSAVLGTVSLPVTYTAAYVGAEYSGCYSVVLGTVSLPVT